MLTCPIYGKKQVPNHQPEYFTSVYNRCITRSPSSHQSLFPSLHVSPYDQNPRFRSLKIVFFQVPVPNFRFRLSMYPKCSMYGICVYIYPETGPNVGKYSIHGASGNCCFNFSTFQFSILLGLAQRMD